MKTLLITTTTLLAAALAGTTHAGIINGDFSSTTMGLSDGDETSLNQGWRGRSADDGVLAADNIHISAGETIGTPGVLTHIKNKPRFGQYFTIDEFTGTGWSLDFDMGGPAVEYIVLMWVGTLDDTPSGPSIRVESSFDAGPAISLVDGGWTKVLNNVAVSGAGHKSLAISEDLGDHDVAVFKFVANSATAGTTFDNFAIVPEPSSLALLGLGGLCILRRRRG